MTSNNNIPQGYKQTEIGVIPEDWYETKIGSLGNIVGGGTPNTLDPSFWNGNIQWYTPAEIGNCKYIKASMRTITEKGLNHSSAKILPKGTILLTTRASIGQSAILKTQATTNQGFQSIVVNNECSNEFVYYLLKTKVREMINISSGSTFLEISKHKLSTISVVIPPLAEQKAIATALSDVDALIAALDKKIAKKKLIKQGAMQQLLTGKKRLPGFTEEWVEIKLGDISHIKTGNRNGDQAVLNGLYPFFVRSQNVYRIDSYSFDGEAILVPGEGGIGNIFHYIKGKFDYHQRVYKISHFNNSVCGKYIFFYMLRYFGDYALSLTVKATVDSLRLSTFEKFVISMPNNIKEQQAIATILRNMDKEISDLEAKRDKYRLIKHGMMQKLLTGQIRLKTT